MPAVSVDKERLFTERLREYGVDAYPRVTKAWVDAGYRTRAIDHGARLGTDVHVVQRAPGTKGSK